MRHHRFAARFAVTILAACLAFPIEAAEPATVRLDRTVSPPEWALLERQLLAANTAACREFFARYFDERGFLLCVERWGGDDGPDDASGARVSSHGSHSPPPPRS